MVLAFTEKQKKEIEANRMMVIEFKYNLRKACFRGNPFTKAGYNREIKS